MKSISLQKSKEENERIRRRPLRLRHYLLAVVSAILIAGGLQIQLGMPVEYVPMIAEKYLGDPLAYLLYLLKCSIMRPSDFSLQCELTALFLILIILYVFSHFYKMRQILWAGCFSALFAVCAFFGRIFMDHPSWSPFITGFYQIFKDLCFLAAYGLTCFFCLMAFWAWLNSRPDLIGGHSHLSGKKRMLVYFLVLMICWLPVFLIVWPGNLKGDTVVQILQYFHFPTRFQGYWITNGKDILFSNDHPFIQTLILGFFMDLGHALGWNELGVSFYTFLQIAGYGAVISLFLVSLEHFHTPVRLTRIALMVYCLAPPYVVHAVLISGDSFLTLFFLYFMVEVFWIYKTGGRVLHNKPFLACLFITVFLFCTSKNQCVYIVFLTGLLMLVLFRKKWKRILAALFLPVLLFETLYMGLFFNLMHVRKVGSQEALSLFFQQTARTVCYHGDQLSQDQVEAISAILKYHKIPRRYDPDLADPVKRTFNREAGSREMAEYFKVWLEMGRTYPGEYIQSFLDSTWGYYYPMKPNIIAELYWDNYTFEEDSKESKWIPKVIPESFFRERWIHQLPQTEYLRMICRKIIVLVDELPLISWLAYPGTIMWLLLAMLLVLLLNRNYRSLAAFFPTLLIFAICLLSPKNGNYRYMLPNSFLLPLISAYVVGLFRKQEMPAKQAQKETADHCLDEKYGKTVPDHLL